MKLRNKINLYTAGLFTVLLGLMNIAIYVLFSNLIMNSELDTARGEMNLAIKAYHEPHELIEERALLRAYVPVDGMIRLVLKDKESSSTTTSVNAQFLSEQGSLFYSQDVSKIMEVNGHTYAFHSAPVLQPDGKIANLQVMKSLDEAVKNLRILRLVLIIVTLLALIPVFISSRLLSNLLINPIASMIRTMQEIRQSGHFKRLDVKEKSKDELSEMGDTFNHMIELLEGNYERQKQFVSNASHELKTPLTVIESYASLLKRRGLQDPALFDESIKAIHSEAVRMRELTEQLLQLAKNHEHWNLTWENVHLIELIQQTTRAFQNAYHREIQVNITDSHELIIQTDEQKLKQLLFIFLDNARKYSDNVIAIEVELAGDFVNIRIKDKGIGIPKEDLPHIFDRFYRVDQGRSRKTGGSGLGLSLAKELADAMNIHVSVDSLEQKGTTVLLQLPK